MNKYLLLVILLTLTSCATVPPAPKVIETPLNVFVPIPAELTADCAVPTLQGRTWGNLADLTVQLRGSLAECTNRMQAIRGIEGKPQPVK